MRIKYIVPFPFDEVGLANRAAQLPDELRTPGVDYEFVPVRNSCHNADSAYELLILDAYIAEAGLAQRGGGLRRGRHGHGLGLRARGAALAADDPGPRAGARRSSTSPRCSASGSRS